MMNCIDKDVLVDGEVEFIDPHKDDEIETHNDIESLIASLDDTDV